MKSRYAIATVLLLAAFAHAGEKKSKGESVERDRATMEKQFAEKMTNATLIGSFTIDGKGDGKAPRAERYELGKVSKQRGDYWTFVAKIKYGKQDYVVPIPITVKVLWAGDTPMVSLTDMKIVGMKGKFTARVLFYGDRYVGTWQHDAVGGHMFGKIVTKADNPKE